jgi:lipoprotein signal peptidase
MTIAAPLPTTFDRSAAVELVPARRAAALRRARWLALLFGVVTAADQLSKAWAWRHLELVHMDSGGGLLLGDRAGGWFRDGVLGPTIDGVALIVVALLALLLIRRRLPFGAFAGVGLVLAGWTSNLGDRLGLHRVTAPGTTRGVVDFVHWDGRLWNVADFGILAGVLLVLATVVWRTLRRPAPAL